jgi:hypothetical protein
MGNGNASPTCPNCKGSTHVEGEFCFTCQLAKVREAGHINDR